MGVVTKYKLVYYAANGKRISTTMFGALAVTYEPGEWVRAPIGGLLVYSKRYKPAIPNTAFDRLELWEVEVRERVPLPKYRVHLLHPELVVRRLTHNLWDGVWDGKEIGQYLMAYLSSWPEGTEAWKEVKLLKMVARGGA